MAKGYELPLHVVEAVKRETAGRTVHWVGQSDARVAFWWTTLVWLFAVPWTAFAVGWELAVIGALFSGASDTMPSAMRTGLSIIFPLWGLPFIAIGVVMLATPFWVARACRNTAHVIVGHELMDVTANRGRMVTVKRFNAREVRKIERTEKPDGSGTLKITTGWHKDSEGDKVENAERWIGIPDVGHVEALILKLRSGEL